MDRHRHPRSDFLISAENELALFPPFGPVNASGDEIG
jgi:hypothetical protein